MPEGMLPSQEIWAGVRSQVCFALGTVVDPRSEQAPSAWSDSAETLSIFPAAQEVQHTPNSWHQILQVRCRKKHFSQYVIPGKPIALSVLLFVILTDI